MKSGSVPAHAQRFLSATDDILRVEKRPEELAEPGLHFARPVEPALAQRLESLLRFGPRQRGRKGAEGIEKAIGGWQRDLIDEILRRRDRAPVEGSDSLREHIDEGVQLIVRKCPIDVSVSLRRLAVEVVCAANDFQSSAAADELRKAFGTAATRL